MFKKLAVILLLILCGVWLYLSFDSEIQGDLSQLPAPPSIQKLSSDLAGSLTPMNFWEFEEGEDYAIADSPCGFGQESMIGRTYEVNNQKLNVLPVYAYEDKKVSDLMAKVRNTLGKRAVVLYYDAQAGLEDPDKGFMEFLSTFYNKPVLDANVEIPALRPLVIISPENDLIKFCRDPLPEDYQLQMPAGENYWDMVYLPQVGGMNSALRKAYSMNLFDGSDEQLVYDGELEEEFQPGIYRVGIIAADLEEGDKALCFGQGCDESDESVIAPESEQNPDENADGGAVNPNNDDQNTGSEDIVLPGGTTIKLPNKGIPTKGGINVSSNRSALFNTENQMKLVFKRHGNQLIDAGKSDINVFNAFAEDLDAVIGNELYTELASSLKLSFRRLQSMFLLINLNLKNYNMQELTQNNLKRIVGEFLDDENFTIGMQNKLYKIDDDFHILTGLYLDVNSSLEDHLRELKYYNIDQKDELKLSLANALLPFSAYEIEDIEARLLQRVNAVEILVRLLDQLLKNEDIKQKNIDDFLTVSNNLFNNLKFNNNTKNLYLDIIKGHIPEIDPMDGIVISHMYENGQGVFMYPAYKFMNIINNNDDNRTLKVTITGGGQFKIKINDTEETSDDGVIEELYDLDGGEDLELKLIASQVLKDNVGKFVVKVEVQKNNYFSEIYPETEIKTVPIEVEFYNPLMFLAKYKPMVFSTDAPVPDLKVQYGHDLVLSNFYRNFDLDEFEGIDDLKLTYNCYKSGELNPVSGECQGERTLRQLLGEDLKIASRITNIMTSGYEKKKSLKFRKFNRIDYDNDFFENLMLSSDQVFWSIWNGNKFSFIKKHYPNIKLIRRLIHFDFMQHYSDDTPLAPYNRVEVEIKNYPSALKFSIPQLSDMCHVTTYESSSRRSGTMFDWKRCSDAVVSF